MPRELPTEAIPSPVIELCRRIEAAGHRAWVVGGCVRDLLMGRAVSDWDLATSALPGEVQRIFRRTIPTGIEHGTVTVLFRGEPYEVTTLRGDGAYSDGRRPDSVEFVREIGEDLARRDFTVNAIAYDPVAEVLSDPWGGLADLDGKLIRAVGDPALRFGEDGLRVLRAARFVSSLGFTIEPATEAAIAPTLETFARVSPERVTQEWMKALKAERPSPGFRVLRRTGILGVTCAPLAEMAEEAFARSLARLDACPGDPVARLAALLLRVEPEGSVHSWADGWLRGMRVSNPDRKRVLAVLKARDTPSPPLTGAALRRWTRDVGRAALEDVLTVASADEAVGGPPLGTLAADARALASSGVPLTPGELPIGGQDVMRTLGIRPSRRVGDLLAWLHERVLDDPSEATAERLLALLADAPPAEAER